MDDPCDLLLPAPADEARAEAACKRRRAIDADPTLALDEPNRPRASFAPLAVGLAILAIVLAIMGLT